MVDDVDVKIKFVIWCFLSPWCITFNIKRYKRIDNQLENRI